MYNDGMFVYFLIKKRAFFLSTRSKYIVTMESNQTEGDRSFWCDADEDNAGILIELDETCHPSTMAAIAFAMFMMCSSG